MRPLLIGLFIYIVFFLFIRKKSNSAGKSGRNQTRVSAEKQRYVKQQMSPAKNTGMPDVRISNSLHDDRTGDWMAQQLREERAALNRINSMFGFSMDKKYLYAASTLKEEHQKNCDAGFIRKQHLDNCDASGVDTAQGS